MNKLAIVLGAAAVAVFAGCMDPNYVPPSKRGAQNEVKPASDVAGQPTLTPDVRPVSEEDLPGYPGSGAEDISIDVGTAPTAGCKCAPGTVHEKPCACGAADCNCAVVPPPPPPPPPVSVVAPVADDNATVYYVRPGDTLFLISKRFNIKLDSIRKANPQLKGDNIQVGQKLTLPGKVELGNFAEPVAVPQPPKKEYKPYDGPTVDYVVKNGDCVSRIAAKNGLSSRQLKELNGLKDDNIRIGQKLKIPAGGAVAAAPAVVAKPAVAEKKVEPKKPAAKVEEPQPPVIEEPVVDDMPVVEPPAPPAKLDETKPETTAAAAAPSVDLNSGDYVPYVVLKGEDITALSISFGIDPSVIREINNMGDDDQLVPGQTIRLPADVQ